MGDEDRTADIIRSRLKGDAGPGANPSDDSDPYAASEERFQELKREEMQEREEKDRQKEREENEPDIYDPEEEGNILH